MKDAQPWALMGRSVHEHHLTMTKEQVGIGLALFPTLLFAASQNTVQIDDSQR